MSPEDSLEQSCQRSSPVGKDGEIGKDGVQCGALQGLPGEELVDAQTIWQTLLWPYH
jgi:hypothetical protein